MAFVMIHIYMD